MTFQIGNVHRASSRVLDSSRWHGCHVVSHTQEPDAEAIARTGARVVGGSIPVKRISSGPTADAETVCILLSCRRTTERLDRLEAFFQRPQEAPLAVLEGCSTRDRAFPRRRVREIERRVIDHTCEGLSFGGKGLHVGRGLCTAH